MPYNIEVIFKQGSINEYNYDETFNRLEDAIRRIEVVCRGYTFYRAWINNKEVRVRNGYIIGNDGQPFCSNQKWHDLFAIKDYPKILTNL